MEQVRNEQTIYSTVVYCRLSKDDEQAGESVSIETQKMMLEDFCHERGSPIYEIYADDGYSGLTLYGERQCKQGVPLYLRPLGQTYAGYAQGRQRVHSADIRQQESDDGYEV